MNMLYSLIRKIYYRFRPREINPFKDILVFIALNL